MLLPVGRVSAGNDTTIRSPSSTAPGRRYFVRGAGIAGAFRLVAALAHRRHRRFLHRCTSNAVSCRRSTVPYLNSTIDGRIDVTHDTQIVVENRFLRRRPTIRAAPTCRPGLPGCRSTPRSAARSASRTQFNRLIVSLKGTFDRAQYQNSHADRRRDTQQCRPRLQSDMPASCASAIDLDAGPQAVRRGQQRYARPRPAIRRSASSAIQRHQRQGRRHVDLFGTLTGEMAVGYLDRTYQDPTLPRRQWADRRRRVDLAGDAR